MYKLVDDIHSFIPTLRVNNRDVNLEFYNEILGFKTLYEENALAVLGTFKGKKERIILEESPSMWTRKVSDGIKKLRKIVVKAEAEEIEELVKRNLGDKIKVYSGEKGYAFEAKSPEGDLFLIHAEDDLACLKKTVEYNFIDSDLDFVGLSDFTIQKVEINVPNVGKAVSFYENIYGEKAVDGVINLPFVSLAFFEEEGQDLLAGADDTWDLELLELKLNKEANLDKMKEKYESFGYEVFVNKAKNLLTMTDSSEIETWFIKDK